VAQRPGRPSRSAARQELGIIAGDTTALLDAERSHLSPLTGDPMKTLFTAFAIALAVIANPALSASNAPASSPTAKPSACESQAAEKKLYGAAKDSFVKKCEKDAASAATTTCESQAADKKLSGAAKNSFVKKCVTDATK
jgi:hypothetical protein